MPNAGQQQLIDRLAGELEPVRRRSDRTDALTVALLCGLELALFLGAGMARPDLRAAAELPSFWWKLGSCGLFALAAAAAAIRSFDPAETPRRYLRWLPVIVALSAGAGALIDGAARDQASSLIARLGSPGGVRCVATIVGLSLPSVAAFGLLMRRGAATEPGGTALAAGVAAAAWAAFVFAFACPHDDPLYVAVWYGAGCGPVVLLARLLLPTLTRW